MRCFVQANDKHLAAFAELLELDPKEMREWLCQRKITSMREVFFKPMNTQEVGKGMTQVTIEAKLSVAACC